MAQLDKYLFYDLFYIFPFENPETMKKISKKEYMIIEPFIEGKYEKYVSNSGWINPNTDKIIHFFMHWNCYYSKGKALISDIQGVKHTKYYELTDPAVQSFDNEYGPADLGTFGLLQFIFTHKHNEYCIGLPWPNDTLINKTRTEIKRTKYAFESIGLNERYKEVYIKILNATFNDQDDDLFSPLIFIIILMYLLPKLINAIILIIQWINKNKVFIMLIIIAIILVIGQQK